MPARIAEVPAPVAALSSQINLERKSTGIKSNNIYENSLKLIGSRSYAILESRHNEFNNFNSQKKADPNLIGPTLIIVNIF